MQSGSDSSDSRYDSRDDSRYDSAPPRARKRGTVAAGLAYAGLSLNLLVVLVGAWGWANNISGFGLIPFFMVIGTLAVSGLTVNVLTIGFGLTAVRADATPDVRAAGRVCAVVAILQLLTVLALAVFAGGRLWGQLFPAPMVTKPMTAVPATYQAVQPSAAADERPTVQSRPTVQEKGQ